jgi:hypothetical protein
MAKDTKSNDYLTQSLSISPQSDLTIEDYIGTDRFGIYVHGTKGGWNDLPLEGCYHGDAWVVNQHVVMWSETEKQWVDLGVIAGVQGKTGPAGEQGVQGIQGEQGVQGERGLTGEQGAVGPQGIQGIQGPAGLGLYICGVLEDEVDLQFQCVSRIGQTYFINRQAWMWDGEEFVNLGEIQGVQGVAGPTGERGEQGLQGERGEKGEKGETGAQGATGAQGIQGEQGEKGDTGDSVTLVVRDVHVGEPDTVPIINISSLEGKPPIQYIDFTIPQGKRGEPGVIGPPNYLEVAGVYTLPASADARVEITNEQSYGVKLLTSNGVEYLLTVNSYGRLYTEQVTAQNDVPGSALSVIEVESDPDAETNTVLWELTLDDLGKVKLYNSDYDFEEPEPEPEEPDDSDSEAEDNDEEYELLRLTRTNQLIRTSTSAKPLVFIAPNKTHWRLGVTADTHQLYTVQVDDELVESDSYINQKITFFIPQGIQGVKGDIGLQGPINLITAGEIKILEEYEEPKVWIDQLEVEHAKEIPDADTVLLSDSNNVYQLGISATGRLQAELLPSDQEYNPEQFIVLVDTETQKEYKVYIENSQLITEPVESGLYLSKQKLVLHYRSQEYYEVTICNTKITTKQLELKVIDDVIATVTQRLNLEIPRGKTGDKGDDGRSNYLRIAGCSTLPEGEQATVELSEPFADKDPRYTIQDIIFGLPMGERGPQGWAIDHKWEGTYLFIKKENESEWGEGVNLKGDKGDSVTFEGGEIVGDTTFRDGRVNFAGGLFYNYQKMAELKTLDDQTAFGYENLIAKNTLQVGYHRWDDRECIGTNTDKHESCSVTLPDNYYDSTDAVITLHTMYGDSTIKQRIDNVLEFVNKPQVQVSTDLFTYNSEEVATQPFVLGKVKVLEDRLDATIGELDVDLKQYIAEAVTECKQHANSAVVTLKEWTDNEFATLRNYVDAQDKVIQDHLSNYVDKKLESLDITGKLTDYIETACTRTYEQSVADAKTYTDERESFVLKTLNSELSEILETANSNCSELVATTRTEVLNYVNDRDQYYFDLTTEKLKAVNDKILLLELQTEELVNQTVVGIYEDILNTNQRINTIATELAADIKQAKTDAFEYTDSELSKLEIPAFKDNVAQQFAAVAERNTIDEKNLEDTNIFLIESLTKIGEMFEELENKVNDFISLKDSNGIEWAIRVDANGRLTSMKKAKALHEGRIVRSESSMVQLLLDYIQILEQRITSLENK